MSTASLALPDEPAGRSVLRWGACGLVVAGLHAGAGLGILAWPDTVAPVMPPPAALMIELAPEPVAPPAEPVDIPPPPAPPVPPEPVLELPPPEPPPEPIIEPEPLPIPEPEPIQVPVPEPEVVLPLEKPKPPPKPLPPRVERPKTEPKKETKPPPPQAAQQQAVAAPEAPTTAAPAPGPVSVRQSNAVPTWQNLVLGRLERHKRYPRSAELRRIEGVAQVRFTMDRQGKVLSVLLLKSSGHAILDEETLATVQRASPLPPPPPEMTQDPVELIVPIQFYVR